MKIIFVLLLLFITRSLHAEPEYPKLGPDIYDREADGMAQIAAAVAQAKSEHKRVLVTLGANWCIWCHRLHDTLETNEAVHRVLAGNYILVAVDVNHRHGKKRNQAVNEMLGNPMALGLPVLVVLDADGKQLTTQETGVLEDGESAHSPTKIIAFLRQWAPKK